MGKIFDWLDRFPGEDIPAYDNRINSLAAFHAGYAFFSSVNYHKELEGFAVYALWNGELNAKLEAPLPNGGFMMHCDLEQAKEFLRYGDAFPIFLRLRSKMGRLYAEHLLVSDRDRLFDFYYNGCEVIPPESTCFRHYPSPEDPHYNEDEKTKEALAGVPSSYSLSGSFLAAADLRGSYRRRPSGKSSFLPTSFRPLGKESGSYLKTGALRGSFLFGGYLTGSYYAGSFRFGRLFAGNTFGERGSFHGFGTGSYRFWGVALLSGSYAGSYRLGRLSIRSGSFGGGSFSLSSFRFGFLSGSYSFGGYIGGSFRNRFFNGSFYGGSYHRGSYVYGGTTEYLSIGEDSSYTEDIMLPGEDSMLVVRGNIPVRRLIEEMGYGLDLI